MRPLHPSRRGFLAGAGALAGSTALLRPDMLWAKALADEELRTVGLSVTVQERILQDFKKASGVGSVSGKADIFPNTQTELLSGSTAYDCWETIGERLPAMTITKTIKPIATSDLKNWANIRPTFALLTSSEKLSAVNTISRSLLCCLRYMLRRPRARASRRAW